MKRSPMKPGRRRRAPVDGVASARWHALVTAEPCAMCQAFPPGRELFQARRIDFLTRQGHHLIEQQMLRRLGLERLLWDERNGMCLCAFHHAQHGAWMQRVPRSLLSARAWEFATALGLDWVLETGYPATTREAA